MFHMFNDLFLGHVSILVNAVDENKVKNPFPFAFFMDNTF